MTDRFFSSIRTRRAICEPSHVGPALRFNTDGELRLHSSVSAQSSPEILSKLNCERRPQEN